MKVNEIVDYTWVVCRLQKGRMDMFPLLMICALICGCAGTPKWVKGIQKSDYYYQGVGNGANRDKAEWKARFALGVNMSKIKVEMVIEDYKRDRQITRPGGVQDFLEDDEFIEWGQQRLSGEIPPETYIVEHWEGQGKHWAYAVVEKPGQSEKINRRYRQAITKAKRCVWLPGWAQFQKQQPGRAWFFISGVGGGLLGGMSFASSCNEALDRRDQAKARIEWDHFNKLAKQRFWISTGLYSLAGGMFIVSIVDGLTSEPKSYQILTQVGSGKVILAFRF